MHSQTVFHLSHTDLDGYSCQLISSEIFKNVRFYNANYGKEISDTLKILLSDIWLYGSKKNLILITDLNLTIEQCEFLLKEIEKAQRDIEILLLDHHKTGQDCANKYNWYHLDSNRSATKITYDYFLDKYPKIGYLEKFVNVVNAIDIWISDSEYFELGKVCMKLVADSKEINRVLFAKENSEYIFYLIKNSWKYFDKEHPQIALDDNIHFIKKSFFRGDGKDDTIENLIANFVVKLLNDKKEQMSVTYKGYKGLLTYSIGNTTIVGNAFLLQNPDYDFFIDINSRKNVSLRGNNKVDVSLIAKELFAGGGHANASGGRYEAFVNSYSYDNIKTQIQNLMNQGSKDG